MSTSRLFSWALAAVLILPVALRAGLFPQPVRPVLEYVVDNPDGSFTAWFGYDNLNPIQVSIPIGHDNRFTPPPQDRGQPTTFLPGRHEAVFSLNFTNGNPTWRLDGESVSAGRNQKPGGGAAGRDRDRCRRHDRQGGVFPKQRKDRPAHGSALAIHRHGTGRGQL
jgi:hypothetical protein